MPRYGYFALGRAKRWRLSIPDAEPSLFEVKEDAEESRMAWIGEHELPPAIAAWEEARERFFEGCAITTRKTGSGFTAREENWILFPTGEQRPLGVLDPQDVTTKVWLDHSPEPTVASIVPISAATLDQVVIWEGELFLGEESRKLPLISHWVYGLPIDFVLETLNKLSDEGWEVLLASEDRGLFAGKTAGSEAYVTRVRYLLSKA